MGGCGRGDEGIGSRSFVFLGGGPVGNLSGTLCASATRLVVPGTAVCWTAQQD